MKLTDSVQFLKGVGPKSVENFHKLGIFTVQDLLLYFPFRYEDFASRSVFELVDGEKATIIGTVVTPANVQYYGFKRNRLSFTNKNLRNKITSRTRVFTRYIVDTLLLLQELNP